jgi:FkbM family methyltransferase
MQTIDSSQPAIVKILKGRNMLQQLRYHARYLSFAAGRKRRVGNSRYSLKGYFPDKFCATDEHEAQLVKVIGELLGQRQGAFIDVGANVEQTLCKVLAHDRDRQYIGFEPQIACCFYVDQFIQRNSLVNAQILPVALGDSSGLLELFASSDIDEMASSSMTNLPAIAPTRLRKVYVPVMRGDQTLAEFRIEAIAVVKIDVEGAELNVLRGLADTLRRLRPAVLFEVLPNFVGHERTSIDSAAAAENTRRSQEIWNFFREIAYVVHQIDASGKTTAIDSFRLDDATTYVGRDYLAISA